MINYKGLQGGQEFYPPPTKRMDVPPTIWGRDISDDSLMQWPTEEKMKAGVAPLETYPAQWMNQLQNYMTSNLDKAVRLFLDVYRELQTILEKCPDVPNPKPDGNPIAPNPLDHEQVFKAIWTMIDKFDISGKKIDFTALPYPNFNRIDKNMTLTNLFAQIAEWYDEILKDHNDIIDLKARLQAEIDRAIARENALEAMILAEEARAKSEEARLDRRIDATNSRVLTIENWQPGVNSLLSSHTSSINSLWNTVNNNTSRISSLEDKVKGGFDNSSLTYNSSTGKWEVSKTWVKNQVVTGYVGFALITISVGQNQSNNFTVPDVGYFNPFFLSCYMIMAETRDNSWGVVIAEQNGRMTCRYGYEVGMNMLSDENDLGCFLTGCPVVPGDVFNFTNYCRRDNIADIHATIYAN